MVPGVIYKPTRKSTLQLAQSSLKQHVVVGDKIEVSLSINKVRHQYECYGFFIHIYKASINSKMVCLWVFMCRIVVSLVFRALFLLSHSRLTRGSPIS